MPSRPAVRTLSDNSDDAVMRLTTLNRKYTEVYDRLENDKVRLMAYLSSHISQSSKDSISWTMLGLRAVKENDPRDLLSAVVITHTSGPREVDLLNIINSERAFVLHAMQPGETSVHHFRIFQLLFSALKLEHINTDLPMRKYAESYLRIHFLRGLNSNYAEYVNSLTNGSRRWPVTLHDSLIEAYVCEQGRGDVELYGSNTGGQNTSLRGRGGGMRGSRQRTIIIVT